MSIEYNRSAEREKIIQHCRMIEQGSFEWSASSVITVLDDFVSIFEVDPEDWRMFELFANFINRMTKSPLKTKKETSSKALQHRLSHIVRLVATNQSEEAVNWARVNLVAFLCCKICKGVSLDLQDCLSINSSTRSLRSLLFIAHSVHLHIKIEVDQLSEIITCLEKITNDKRILDNSYICLDIFNALKSLRRLYLLDYKADIYNARNNEEILTLLNSLNDSIWSLQAIIIKAHPKNSKDETMPLVIVQNISEYIQLNLFLNSLEFILEHIRVFQALPNPVDSIYLSKFRTSNSRRPPQSVVSEIEQIAGNVDISSPTCQKMFTEILNVQEFLLKQPETPSGVFEFHFLKLVSPKGNSVFTQLGMISYELLVEMTGKYLRGLRRTTCLDYFQIFFTIFLTSSKIMQNHPKIIQYVCEVSLPIICKLASNVLKEMSNKEQEIIIDNFLAMYLKEVCKQDKLVAICRAVNCINTSTHPKVSSRLIALGEELLKAEFPQFSDNDSSSQENYLKMKNLILKFEIWMLLKRTNLVFSFEQGKDLLNFVKQSIDTVKMNPIDKASLQISLKIMKIGFCNSNSNLNIFDYSRKMNNLLFKIVDIVTQCAKKLDWLLNNYNWMFHQFDLAHRNSDIFLQNRTPNFSLLLEANADAVLSIITNIQRILWVNKLYKTRVDLRAACGFVFYLLKGFGANSSHMTYFLLHYFSFVKHPLNEKDTEKLSKIVFPLQPRKESMKPTFYMQLAIDIARYKVAKNFNFTKGSLIRFVQKGLDIFKFL